MLEQEAEFKVYSREDCEYCWKAKQLLQGMELTYESIQQDEGRVPQIYYGEQHIGGYEDLTKFLKEGDY